MPASTPIGIDLGTTFSVVAYLDSTGRPCTITNSEGDLITPSVVLLDGTSSVVGKEAVKAAGMEPDRIADFAKRDMGSMFYSKKVGGEQLPPEVIQSLILEKLKRDAELKLGPIDKAVVTVPAFFNEPRRKATQDAAQLAGLQILDIINEPTAAAIAFGYQVGFLDAKGEARQKETILVYDLGGGTFDVTLMEIEGSDFTAIATGGDVYLGGIDWDRRLADHIADKFRDKHHGFDPRQDAAGIQRLLKEAEDAKRSLSARDSVTITFEHVGQGIRLPITRAEFEEMTADLLERTRFTIRSLLKEARLQWSDLTRLLLVGGSSRMPMVQKMLEEESGLKVDRSLSPDEAVAHGAALYAGLLMARDVPTAAGKPAAKPAMRVRNVSSHDLGVLSKDPATGRSVNSVIIPRNTVLPVTKGKRYRTAKVGQKSIVINVIEGGDGAGRNSTPIGRCTIRELPSDFPAGSIVEVYFTYGENGRLKVEGRLPELRRKATLSIERASGLNDDKLNEWGDRLKAGRGR
ncbi:MAG: Hsp70 family protein [Planctomycetes bacterium]|nr:Hsp70 family protein [Planctomycetota bacterium]